MDVRKQRIFVFVKGNSPYSYPVQTKMENVSSLFWRIQVKRSQTKVNRKGGAVTAEIADGCSR